METKTSCHAIAAIATVCQVDTILQKKDSELNGKAESRPTHLRLFDRKTRHWEEKHTTSAGKNVQTVGATENQTETYLISLPESFLMAFWFPKISRALWYHGMACQVSNAMATKQSLEWRTGQGHAAATPSRIMVTLHHLPYLFISDHLIISI